VRHAPTIGLHRFLVKDIEELEVGNNIQSQVKTELQKNPARVLPARAV